MNQVAHPPSQAWQSPVWTVGRIASLTAGVIVIVLGISCALVGATVLSQQHEGSIDLGSGNYRGDGYAVVSPPLDWSEETYLGSAIERVDFELASAEAAPLFVGLTTPEKAEQYLSGQAELVDDGYRFAYTERSGEGPETAPDEADIWSVSAEGTGSITLDFSTAQQQGERVLVIMRTDGEDLGPGTVDSHGTAPGVTTIGVSLTVIGAVITMSAGMLFVVVLRRVRAAKRKVATT